MAAKRVQVWINPALPPADAAGLEMRVRQEAENRGCVVNDHFRVVMLSNDNGWGVPDSLVHAINSDPNMIALDSTSDDIPAGSGYVIQLDKIVLADYATRTTPLDQLTFMSTDDVEFVREYVPALRSTLDPLRCEAVTIRHSDGRRREVLAGNQGIADVTLDVDVKLLVIAPSWDNLKKHPKLDRLTKI